MVEAVLSFGSAGVWKDLNVGSSGKRHSSAQNTEGQGARPSNISVHRTVWGTQRYDQSWGLRESLLVESLGSWGARGVKAFIGLGCVHTGRYGACCHSSV